MLLGDSLQYILVQPREHICPSLDPGCILLVVHPAFNLLQIIDSYISLYVFPLQSLLEFLLHKPQRLQCHLRHVVSGLVVRVVMGKLRCEDIPDAIFPEFYKGGL